MNRKKIIALIMVVALALTTLVGGTLAYFTDDDDAVNVMVMGNVNIKQNEEQRGEEAGEMEEFEQNKDLFPAVNLIPEGESFMVEDDTIGETVFNPGIKNVIDKFVTVTNEDTVHPAYVRTILAFETVIQYKEGTDEEINLHDIYFLVNGDFDYLYNEDGTAMVIEIDGVQYWLAECVYEEALAPEATSATSLRQLALTWDAGNEAKDLFGDEYTVLAISQGTQVEGFETVGARVALDTAFGKITEESAKTWFEAIFPAT